MIFRNDSFENAELTLRTVKTENSVYKFSRVSATLILRLNINTALIPKTNVFLICYEG